MYAWGAAKIFIFLKEDEEFLRRHQEMISKQEVGHEKNTNDGFGSWDAWCDNSHGI
jgi:hypothetical protein